jgi:hypothetical protein
MASSSASRPGCSPLISGPRSGLAAVPSPSTSLSGVTRTSRSPVALVTCGGSSRSPNGAMTWLAAPKAAASSSGVAVGSGIPATTRESSPKVPPAPTTAPPAPVRCSAAQRMPRSCTSPPAMSTWPNRTWADARRSCPSISSAALELLPSPDASSSPSASDADEKAASPRAPGRAEASSRPAPTGPLPARSFEADASPERESATVRFGSWSGVSGARPQPMGVVSRTPRTPRSRAADSPLAVMPW